MTSQDLQFKNKKSTKLFDQEDSKNMFGHGFNQILNEPSESNIIDDEEGNPYSVQAAFYNTSYAKPTSAPDS